LCTIRTAAASKPSATRRPSPASIGLIVAQQQPAAQGLVGHQRGQEGFEGSRHGALLGLGDAGQQVAVEGEDGAQPDAAVDAAKSWQPERFSTCALCAEDVSYNRSGDVSY
jgi:hypothetical protein